MEWMWFLALLMNYSPKSITIFFKRTKICEPFFSLSTNINKHLLHIAIPPQNYLNSHKHAKRLLSNIYIKKITFISIKIKKNLRKKLLLKKTASIQQLNLMTLDQGNGCWHKIYMFLKNKTKTKKTHKNKNTIKMLKLRILCIIFNW